MITVILKGLGEQMRLDCTAYVADVMIRAVSCKALRG